MNPVESKNQSRGVSTDMSGEAILRRLEIVSELRDLCLLLGTAQPPTREPEHVAVPADGDGYGCLKGTGSDQ